MCRIGRPLLHPQNQRGLGVQVFGTPIVDDKRGVVTGIAVADDARVHVENPKEHRDEHDVGVVLADGGVEGLHDAFGTVNVGRQRAEKAVGDGHQQRGGNPLAGNVADAEQQLVVADVVVVQVAAHELSWILQPTDIYGFVILCQFVGGQQRLLDFAGDGELVLNVLLLGTHLVELPQVLDRTVGDEHHRKDACKGHQCENEAGPPYSLVHFTVGNREGQGHVLAVNFFRENVGFDPPFDRIRRSHQHRAVAGNQRTVAVRMEFDAPDNAGEGVKRDIRDNQTHRLAVLVPNGKTIGNHLIHAAGVVIVGIAPEARLRRHPFLEPFHLEVVVLRAPQLFGDQRVTALVVTDVGLEPVPFFGIVIRLEGDARTHNAAAGLHRVTGDFVHCLGIVKGIFCQRPHGFHGSLNLPHADENRSLGALQGEFRPFLSHLECFFPDVEIVGHTDQHQRKNDDEHLQEFLLRKAIFVGGGGHYRH